MRSPNADLFSTRLDRSFLGEKMGFLKDVLNLGLAAVPGVGQYMATKEANETNMALAAQNTAFQESMSNTSYQRGMEDMRKAGLNPMLAISQGGASTPQGSVAQVEPEDLSGLGQSALDAYRLKIDTNKLKNETDLKNSQVALQTQQGQQAVANAQAAKSQEEYTKTQQAKMIAEMPATIAKSKYEAQKAGIDSDWAKFDSFFNRILSGTGAVTNAIRAAKPTINLGVPSRIPKQGGTREIELD